MMKTKTIFALTIFTLLVLAVGSAFAAAEGGMDMNTAAKKANNPVSGAWLLILQNDFTFIDGDATNGTEVRERLSFQPVMSVPIFGGSWNLVNTKSQPRKQTFNPLVGRSIRPRPTIVLLDNAIVLQSATDPDMGPLALYGRDLVDL